MVSFEPQALLPFYFKSLFDSYRVSTHSTGLEEVRMVFFMCLHLQLGVGDCMVDSAFRPSQGNSVA